jgi:CRISPR-associated protein Csx10
VAASDRPDACPICRLFGSPRAMKRWRIGSARPENDGQVNVQRVARVRVSPRTRRAAPHQLFSQEQGSPTTFVFTATCPAEDEAAQDEAALLVAAARFVRQLGRSRRRGLGECLFTLKEIEGIDVGAGSAQAWAMRRFETRWLNGQPAALDPSGGERLTGERQPGEEELVRLRLLARADEPLLIARRASAGNQFQGQPAITGKTLRGALAARAAGRFDLGDDVTYDAFVDIFLRGGVRFPTLYPLFRDENGHFYPAIPTPKDGRACKVYASHPILWGTREGEDVDECPVCASPIKRMPGELAGLRRAGPRRFSPERRSEMHVHVDPKMGRAAEGDLFEYVALEAGQLFAGELVCADGNAWDLLQDLTGLVEQQPVTLRLGKATRRGYGEMTLWLERMDEDDPSPWIQQAIRERVKEDESDLTLTLLSDAVVTDTWGRFATGFEVGWLRDQLPGIPLEPKTEAVECGFAGAKDVDGFNTKLRLPRWRDVALAAGSSARLRLAAPLDAEAIRRLEEIERDGIGLRRSEGFGQIAFNHPVYTGDGSEVTIPDALRTDEAKTETATPWRKQWEEALAAQPETEWDECRGEPFLALARWLDARRHEGVQWLLAEMQSLGEPNGVLVERLGGKEEYGDRGIAAPLAKKEGFALVERLLEQLRDHDPAHHLQGVHVLADRLAEVAGEKEKGQ